MNILELDPKTTALILIDLQNGIVAMNLAPYTSIQVVDKCLLLVEKFRKSNAVITYVHVDLPNFRVLPTDIVRSSNVPPPSASELISNSGYKDGDLLITKLSWGAFEQTNLEEQLHARGIKTIVIGGIATNFGVESTARTAAALGFEVVIAEDAMSSASTEFHNFSITNIFPRIARVRKTNEIVLQTI